MSNANDSDSGEHSRTGAKSAALLHALLHIHRVSCSLSPSDTVTQAHRLGPLWSLYSSVGCVSCQFLPPAKRRDTSGRAGVMARSIRRFPGRVAGTGIDRTLMNPGCCRTSRILAVIGTAPTALDRAANRGCRTEPIAPGRTWPRVAAESTAPDFPMIWTTAADGGTTAAIFVVNRFSDCPMIKLTASWGGKWATRGGPELRLFYLRTDQQNRCFRRSEGLFSPFERHQCVALLGLPRAPSPLPLPGLRTVRPPRIRPRLRACDFSLTRSSAKLRNYR